MVGNTLLDTKGVSPVIGVVLLVGITLLLAAVTGTMAFGLSDTTEKPPTTAFSTEFHEKEPKMAGDAVEITPIGGNSLDASNILIRSTKPIDLGGCKYTFGSWGGPPSSCDPDHISWGDKRTQGPGQFQADGAGDQWTSGESVFVGACDEFDTDLDGRAAGPQDSDADGNPGDCVTGSDGSLAGETVWVIWYSGDSDCSNDCPIEGDQSHVLLEYTIPEE